MACVGTISLPLFGCCDAPGPLRYSYAQVQRTVAGLAAVAASPEAQNDLRRTFRRRRQKTTVSTSRGLFTKERVENLATLGDTTIAGNTQIGFTTTTGQDPGSATITYSPSQSAFEAALAGFQALGAAGTIVLTQTEHVTFQEGANGSSITTRETLENEFTLQQLVNEATAQLASIAIPPVQSTDQQVFGVTYGNSARGRGIGTPGVLTVVVQKLRIEVIGPYCTYERGVHSSNLGQIRNCSSNSTVGRTTVGITIPAEIWAGDQDGYSVPEYILWQSWAVGAPDAILFAADSCCDFSP